MQTDIRSITCKVRSRKAATKAAAVIQGWLWAIAGLQAVASGKGSESDWKVDDALHQRVGEDRVQGVAVLARIFAPALAASG